MSQNYIEYAVDLVGGQHETSKLVGVSQPAVSKWVRLGRLPRTEATGETQYAELMAKAHPKISKKKLLATVYRNGAP